MLLLDKENGVVKLEEEVAPHIRAYCVKEDLDEKLFRTDIRVIDCHAPDVDDDAVVLCIVKNKSEELIVNNQIIFLAKTEDHGYKLRGIPIVVLYEGDSKIKEYLNATPQKTKFQTRVR